MGIRSPEPPPWCHPGEVNVKNGVLKPSGLYVWLTVLVDPLARHSNLNLTSHIQRTSPINLAMLLSVCKCCQNSCHRMKSRPPGSSEPIFIKLLCLSSKAR